MEKEVQNIKLRKLEVAREMQTQVTFLLNKNKEFKEQLVNADEDEVFVIQGLIAKNKKTIRKLMEDIE